MSRCARSLDVLLDEIDAAAPNRAKHSDGWIGDEDHQSRDSDHNDWVPPPQGGVVTARDFTHDPKGGLDCSKLAEHLRRRAKAGDKRIKYIIWNGRISSERDGWAWRKYTGSNAHTKHLHLSVVPVLSIADVASPWRWGIKIPKPGAGAPVATADEVGGPWTGWNTGTPGRRVLSLWDRGRDVAVLQKFIGDCPDDGYFGPATKARVKQYQKMRGLTADGIVGPKTWGPILKALG